METLTVNSNNDSKASDNNDDLGKLKRNYLLLKRKICRTHELIRQYNDKMKECDRINIELGLAHTELKTLRTNYNGVLGKVIKLELQNTEYEKQITSMSSTTEAQEIQIAGNQQHLHQLSCKLKEVEDKHTDEKMQWEVEKSVLKDKIKQMKHELKINNSSNSSVKKINKSQGIEKGTNCNFQNLISKVNVAVNTTNDSTIARADKNVITNLSFGIKKNDVYPLFCDNCDSNFSDPVKAICKTMTKKYKMIEPIPPYRELEEDQKNEERLNFQNPSKDKSKSNNSTFELSKISSALKEDQNPHIVKEEISINPVQQTTTETLTHHMDELRNQMKRLEKKIKKQSHKKEPPDYNYFQPSPYRNYFHNDMLNYNSLFNLMSQVLNKVNNVNETTSSSKKIRKKKHESTARKLILKKINRKRIRKIVSASNDAWKVDSIVPCYKQIIRTDNSTSNNYLNKSPSLINNDLVLDNDSNNTNVEEDICHNNIIETANDNRSKLNSSNDKQCLSSTIIEEIQPVHDTRSILESLNLKSNTSLQHKTIVVTDKDTINDLNPTSNITSILNADISVSNKSNLSDIKKQINIPFTKESENIENTIEDISNPIDKVPIHVNTLDSTSNITAINNIVKNRKRKLQIFENKLNQLNLIKDSLTQENNNKSIHNIESNALNIIENTRKNISEKKINNKSNIQIVNSDVVLKKKQRIIHEAETSNQEVSTLNNENFNVIQEMDDESIKIAQANILDCTSLNKRETERIAKPNNNRKVPKKQHSFKIKKIPKSKGVFATNKNRTRLLGRINSLRSRRLLKIGNLKLFDSNEPTTKKDESIDQKKCAPKPACNINNKMRKRLMKSISELKAINKDLTEDLSDNTFDNETQIKLTDKSETLIENVQMPAANSIDISTDINESTKDECFTTTMTPLKYSSTDINESTKDECFTSTITPLKDSKLMQDEDALININEKAEGENFESCQKIISDEQNKMIESIYLDCSKFKLISPLKERYISKDTCEKSLKNEINEPIQNVAIKPQILNLNEIDTSIHSEYNIESQVTRFETSMFVEEEATAEVLSRSIKETEEFNLESNNIDMKTEKIIEIPLDKEENLIINAEEQHNTAITTKEKSNELMKDTSINNPMFELFSPLKDNQISKDTCESSLENKLKNVATNSQRLPIRELGVLIDSKHTFELKRIMKKNIQKQSKTIELNKIDKDLSTSGNYKNIKVHAKMSTNSINITKPNTNLNIQSHNAIINDKVVSANSRVNNKHADNDNLNSLVTPIVLLKNYLQQNLHPEGLKKSRQELKKQESLYKKTDKFVHKQLSKIVNNIDWAMPIHRDVVEKLSSTCSARIIAKGIVNFMLITKNDNLDRTYTPPAPIMTAAQQKIVALLVDLEMKVPTVIEWVQAGIEFKIFRLNCTPTFCQIENLIRLYIALTKIQKDRGKLRMLCCDALYCLGFSAVPIIYTVLTCWPEVLPQFTENTDMLPKCIAHCIMSLQANHLPQLQSLKNFLSMYFNYKKGSYLTKNLVEELLRSFEIGSHSKENTENLRTAVILLAKKEGVLWTHKNIIKSTLLPNIVGRKYAFVQEIFALLGNLMRTFPLEDKDGIVKNTVEQLTDLLDSGEGPHGQQEGIASALLSLSRHDLMKVINTVMKWIPNEPLRTATMDQYSALFRLRTRAFWKKYLKSVERKLTQKDSKDTPRNNVYNSND